MGRSARVIQMRLMDFAMTLEAMYQGEGVSRVIWGINAPMLWHDSGVIWSKGEGEKERWQPTQEDLLADDWKIVE